MKETIYTIPISEVFEPKDGCPLCRLERTLEKRCIEYISGAAMMEPDIRVSTNQRGFCIAHYRQMLGLANRLPVALMLQSRLEHLKNEVVTKKPSLGRDKRPRLAAETLEGCYVCDKIEWAMQRMLRTLFELYGREEEFRALYREQTGLCYPHYARLIAEAPAHLKKERLSDFLACTTELTLRELQEQKKRIDAFCNMFDYRNAGKGPASDEVRAAIETAIEYLTCKLV